MASTSAVATSSAPLAEETGPQAGPLPSKRGEIGFVDGVHTQAPVQPVDQDTMPARHPADRPPQVPSSDLPNEDPQSPVSSPVSSDSSSINTVEKRTSRWRKKLPKFMGIHFMTLLLMCLQILFFAGTIIGWVFAAMALGGQLNIPTPSPANGQNPPISDHSSSIFVDIAFAVVAIAQLIFLERRFLPSARRTLRIQSSRRSPSDFASARAYVGRRHDSYGTVEPAPSSDVCGCNCSEWCRDWRRGGFGDRTGAPTSIRQDTRKHAPPCRLLAQQLAHSSSRA